MDSLVAEYEDLLIHDVEETGVELGRGSYGVVFEVRWRGEVRAAKKLHDFFFEPEVRDLPGTKKEVRNFKREFRSWANLDHPNMVRLLGLYYNPSRSIRAPIIVMEKMDVSFGDYLERHTRGTFPLHKKVCILLQVAQALSYLHGQLPPLVHHDLKPDNVMLDISNFTAKLTDFGMIRAITPGSLTRASSVKGTPVFMPPEAMEFPLRYDEQLDVFSFGVVVISTLVHDKAPVPLPATVSQGGRQVAVSDIDRRKPFTNQFTVEEKHYFMPVVEQCLEYSWEKRPRSSELVDRMTIILASLHNTMSPAAEGNPVKQNAFCLQQESYAQVVSQSETPFWRGERLHEPSAQVSSEKKLSESSAGEMKMLKEKVARLEKQCSQAEAERRLMEESHVKLQQMYEEVYLENDLLKLQCKDAASHSEAEHRLAQADRAALRKQCQQLLEERKILLDNSAELHQKLADMEYELKGLREFKARYNTKERRELEQTNAELHQKLFDMEAELEKLRPFKDHDQATSGQSNDSGSAANSRPLFSPTSQAGSGGEDSGWPLPPGWESRLTSDGTRYYINCETKSVSWGRPDANWSKSI